MKRTFRTGAIALTVLFAGGALGLAACGGEEALPHTEELLSAMDDPARDYNSDLFYVNSLEFEIADPSVIYIEEGKDAGWFYAYGTSDEIGCHGFQAWRSKDLSHWECTGIAFQPDYADTWATQNYWAPEVIYDKTDRLYYMFYNAYNSKDSNRLWLSVAYSETPDGPFLSPAGRNGYGEQLSGREPVFNVTVSNPRVAERAREMEAQGVSGFAKSNALDASPFVDPATGDKYLFFSYHDDYFEGSFIYGMKMCDWYTPDYGTMTRLTHPNYSTVQRGLERKPADCVEADVNEGPFVICHGGKYYLTFSVFGYKDAQYHVVQAIADSPLGTYTKVSDALGGKVVSTDVVNWTHITSAGHHSFITVGDELFIAYHTFYDRLSIAEGRALAVDRVVWVGNAEGTEVMHTNGPTWSVQPLPASVSGYRDLAPSATLTASNTAAGSDPALLTDGVVKYQEFDLAEEYETKGGKSVIGLSWNGFRTVRGIMIYNSYDYFKRFSSVEKIVMEYLKADGSTGKVKIEDLRYDEDWFVEKEWEFVRPGGAAVAEFADLPVRSIEITLSADDLALNEIVVLGKDAPAAGVEGFGEYAYTNQTYGSAHIERDSANFGTVEIDGKPSALATMYGYDLSHDGEGYITQNGAYDQYAYFKGVYSTQFYVEARFTVPSQRSFSGDAWPKFGLVVSCDEEAQNSIFYYVDADPSYSVNRRVGCAQRMMDNTNWAWGSEERLRDAPGIAYNNGQTVCLAILRKGASFYFICNGRLMLTVNDFNVFNAFQRAAVGFLCFNTPLVITEYSATADESVVAEKLQHFGLN